MPVESSDRKLSEKPKKDHKKMGLGPMVVHPETKETVPRYGSPRKVYNMSALQTRGGLTSKDLGKNKHGEIVSLKKRSNGALNPWTRASGQARRELGIEGFVLMGKGDEGKALHKRAREIHDKWKEENKSLGKKKSKNKSDNSSGKHKKKKEHTEVTKKIQKWKKDKEARTKEHAK